jgi:hypothetical protein
LYTGGNNGREWLNTIDYYDITNQKWTSAGALFQLPRPLGSFACVVYDDHIIICGGWTNGSAPSCDEFSNLCWYIHQSNIPPTYTSLVTTATIPEPSLTSSSKWLPMVSLPHAMTDMAAIIVPTPPL